MRSILFLAIAWLVSAASIRAQAPNISYPQSGYIFPVGTPISPLTPTNTGGAVAAPGTVTLVTTLAGSGNAANVNGTGPTASFYYPSGVALDDSGNVFVADQANNRIRKISPAGVVTTVAGGGPFFYTDGVGSAASFDYPSGVAMDVSGNVYVADQYNDRIRKVSPLAVVTTVAGNGSNVPFADGLGTAANFYGPTEVAVDGIGNVYVADQSNHRIRKISPAGLVTTFAGSGSWGYADGIGATAKFSSPSGVAVDSSGNVYVADSWNHRIRKISPVGLVTTLAGSGTAGFSDGTGTAASFNYPTRIAVDGSGNLYVTDNGNRRIRKINPAGVVTTFAGNGCTQIINGSATGCFAEGAALAASFNNPQGLTVNDSGIVYVADSYNNRIRKITPGAGGGYEISPALPAGLSLDPITGVISGTPTVATFSTNYVVTATNAAGTSSFTLYYISTYEITAPTITPASPTNTYCEGGAVTINFSAGGFFPSNVFIAELSDSTGSFASPVMIGVLNGSSGSTMNATFPVPLSAGTGYRIRIVALSPAATSPDNGQDLSFLTAPPPAQTIITPAQNQSLCSGSAVPFQVSGGTGLFYQWLNNSNIIPGATNNNYTATTSGQYAVMVSGSNGCAVSSATVSVTVNPLPVVAITDNNGVLSTNGSFISYQWYQNGVAIPGATTAAYTTTQPDDAYYLIATDFNGCSDTTNSITPALGIEGLAAGAYLTLAPNPSSQGAELRIHGPGIQTWQVRVTDVMGRVVLVQDLDASGRCVFGAALAPGVYQVAAIGSHQRIVQKWVRQ